VFVRTVFILGAAVLLLAAGCGGSNGHASGGRIEVVAAFYPLAYAAEQVGGRNVDVRNLTPPGTEPHDLELSPRDVGRVRSADVVLMLGDRFQPALERAAKDADGTVVDLLSDLPLLGPSAVEERGSHDPHVWLDPGRYERIVARVTREIRGASAQSFDRRLRALDAEFEDGLADCERRTFVTSHAAFAYLARRYGLKQVAISGLSPEIEPAPRALEAVVREVRRSGATTVFFETLVSPRLAETVAREAGARTAVLNPIEGLTEEQAKTGADYFSLMRKNLRALRGALGCR
jgi:zinc transport system substrate-binding protein